MTNKPVFLIKTELEQKIGFREITAYCDRHLSQAVDPSASNTPWTVKAAFDPRNKDRNRYSNVLPWDRTRVRLPCLKGGSDYINASFVQLDDRKYIAAQGPLRNTIHHFWSMCFSQAEETGSLAVFIAMVTPLIEQNREKCSQYWPTKHQGTWDMSEALRAECLALHGLTVTWLSEEFSDEFVLTTLRLESGGISKKVYHYYYLDWRDTLTPKSVAPLLLLSRKIQEAKQIDPRLIPVVHCSAGVGRTGTFIAIDHFLHLDFDVTSDTDLVFETVKTLRDHRMMMVQTSQQYAFLYQVAKDIYHNRTRS